MRRPDSPEIAKRRVLTILCSLAIGLLATQGMSGCGLLPPETYVIRVDSLTVMPSATSGAVQVRAHGISGRDACGGLDHVERRERADTLLRRFVGERRNGNCLQKPARLDFSEEVIVPQGRTLRYLVQQPDGPPLVRDIPPPQDPRAR